MVPKAFARQVIHFQKESFDKAFTAVDMVQDLIEIWFTVLLEKTWLPSNGVRFADDWIGTRKQDRRTFKDMVDRYYMSAISVFSEPHPKSATEVKARSAETGLTPSTH